MSNGPGKYDDACTAVRVATQASAIILVVIRGHSGSGFSVQGPPEVVSELPATLRYMADQIERDTRRAAP
jgi:hypothetical protein